MTRLSSTASLIRIGLLSVLVFPAQAHDPGLSRARLQIDRHELVMRITFAERDLEAIVPMDGDQDGSVSGYEFSSAKARLQSAIVSGIELRRDRQLLSPESLSVRPVPSEAVEVVLRFRTPVSSSFTLAIPLIAHLARGHRQYLTVHNESGELLGPYVFDASTRPLTVAVTRTGWAGVLYLYGVEGVWHIWIGFDHLLFLLTLMLPAVLTYQGKRWQSVGKLGPALTDILRIVTAFTLAHSVTLALAALQIVQLPPRLVESVIAFSVLATAMNNLRPMFARSRWLLAFAFGLVHGLGFAHVLLELGLPRERLAIALLGFNLGVELGQLTLVFLLFPIAWLIRHTHLYRAWVFRGGSVAAAALAAVWMFERAFDHELLGFWVGEGW